MSKTLLYEWGFTEGVDRGKEVLARLFVGANMSCTSTIELPYFSVAVGNNLMICICCGIIGTKRAFGNYPKSQNYAEKPDVIRN